MRLLTAPLPFEGDDRHADAVVQGEELDEARVPKAGDQRRGRLSPDPEIPRQPGYVYIRVVGESIETLQPSRRQRAAFNVGIDPVVKGM
jgi:hypothetical protein